MKRAAINASGASSEPLGLEAMREALESILVLCADYAGASSVDISVLKEISALASLQLPEAEIQPDWKQDQAETSRLPRVKSLTGSEDMDCVFNPHRYAEPPSEANSTAAPEPCAGCGDSGYPCPYCAAPVDAGVREALDHVLQSLNCLASGLLSPDQNELSTSMASVAAEAIPHAMIIAEALSSQPVVGVDQK